MEWRISPHAFCFFFHRGLVRSNKCCKKLLLATAFRSLISVAHFASLLPIYRHLKSYLNITITNTLNESIK